MEKITTEQYKQLYKNTRFGHGVLIAMYHDRLDPKVFDEFTFEVLRKIVHLSKGDTQAFHFLLKMLVNSAKGIVELTQAILDFPNPVSAIQLASLREQSMGKLIVLLRSPLCAELTYELEEQLARAYSMAIRKNQGDLAAVLWAKIDSFSEDLLNTLPAKKTKLEVVK